MWWDVDCDYLFNDVWGYFCWDWCFCIDSNDCELIFLVYVCEDIFWLDLVFCVKLCVVCSGLERERMGGFGDVW